VGAGALLLDSCRTLAQIDSTHHLIRSPLPEVWHPVLRELVVTVLPFEHPHFPSVSPDRVFEELRHLFPIDDVEEYATLPRALTLFADCSLFPTLPAPFVDDELRDMAASRVALAETNALLEQKRLRERASYASYLAQFEALSFTDMPLDARRAYLSLWGASEFITRRRFYRGVKSLVTISAYSMAPFWRAVGYEGPLLERG
jgi:hypothetical protein